MKHLFNNLYMYVARMDRQHFQFIMLIACLAIAAGRMGAPIGGGDGHP
jgi:hypothetical protein